MADALYRTPAVGEARIAAPTSRISAAADLLLVGADGRVQQVAQSQTVLLSDLTQAVRAGRLEGTQTQTFETALTGWSGYLAGTGSRYIQNPANVASLHDARSVAALALSQGAGTTGSNAAANARSNTDLFAGAGKSWLFHYSVRSLPRIQSLRIGYIGNNSAPTAAGRPANGVWMEFDAGVDASEWSLVAADDGAYTSDLCGPVVATEPDWHWFQFRMNSDTSVTVYQVSPDAAPVELSTLAYGLPSTDARRSGRLFAQLVAADPASGGFALLLLDSMLHLPAAGRVPVLAP